MAKPAKQVCVDCRRGPPAVKLVANTGRCSTCYRNHLDPERKSRVRRWEHGGARRIHGAVSQAAGEAIDREAQRTGDSPFRIVSQVVERHFVK